VSARPAAERATVAGLLAEAERQLDEHDPESAGGWPHAAAVLVRQSLETTLDVYWRRRAPAMLDASFRDRWLCLPAFLGERPAARPAHFAWTALSEACHHRAYDVGLTQDELRGHIATARAFLETVGAALRPPSPH
jgi:hypothetical protein